MADKERDSEVFLTVVLTQFVLKNFAWLNKDTFYSDKTARMNGETGRQHLRFGSLLFLNMLRDTYTCNCMTGDRKNRAKRATLSEA